MRIRELLEPFFLGNSRFYCGGCISELCSTFNGIAGAWTNVSDRRDKTNIEDLDEKLGLAFIRNLETVSFNFDHRDRYVRECGYEYGVKDSTLADLKKSYGFIAQQMKELVNTLNEKESNIAINEIFDGKFGEAKNLLIEEFLEGEEMSYFIISDGLNFKSFETAQDHKRVLEGDKGKNTGGMGAYSPATLLTDKLEKKIKKIYF